MAGKNKNSAKDEPYTEAHQASPKPVIVGIGASAGGVHGERKKRSIGARWPLGSSNSAAAISRLVMCRRRSGGMT